MRRQVPVMVSVVSQQDPGDLGLYGFSRRNLLSVAQLHLTGTAKLGSKRANHLQLQMVFPIKSIQRSRKAQLPAQM